MAKVKKPKTRIQRQTVLGDSGIIKIFVSREDRPFDLWLTPEEVKALYEDVCREFPRLKD